LELFRRLEEEDGQTRDKFDKKIARLAEKVAENNKEIYKKKAKEADNYNKHLVEVQRRYN
jgi:hypothetical protein